MYIQSEYEKRRGSGSSFLIAIAITLLLFLPLATSQLGLKLPEPSDSDTKTVFHIPPPAQSAPEPKPLPRSDSDVSSIDMDFEDPQESIELLISDLQLDWQPNIESAFDFDISNESNFQAIKPDIAQTSEFVIYESHQLDVAPRPLLTPFPDLPFELRKEKAQVMVLYVIKSNGKADNIFILDSSNPELNDITRRALKRWHFRAARKGGRAVDAWVQQEFNFSRGASPLSIF